MAALILPGKRPAGAMLRNTTGRAAGKMGPALTSFAAAAAPETSMKFIAIVLLALAASGCSALRNKPYQASDTTASDATRSQAPGPTQRSTQRMFNPDGSLGIYFGT
jgi:hypothetical protein